MAAESGEGGRRVQGPDSGLAVVTGGLAGLSTFDREVQAWRARVSGGVSLVAFSLAYLDWLAHLAGLPGRQTELAARAWRDGVGLVAGAAAAPGGDEPRAEDPRFAAPGWQRWPFNVLSHAFVLTERWWQEATSGVPGVSRHH